MNEPESLSTDVLIIGAGGAGMYAALSAAASGAQVILVDKNMVGRGGATIMAQMTVAAALAEQEPDSWQEHYSDTLTAGRSLCDPVLAEIVCRQAPERIREMDNWGVGWARDAGHITQVSAPGHSHSRCCYVDFLNTGPAVARTLRRQTGRNDNIRRISDVSITELLTEDERVYGAIGYEATHGRSINIQAASIVIATGGLTKLFARNSASNNMVGEGYALGLQAGAELVDMEFVQFFPIGHLAPRLVGMDPIMWDPFRYKLGGRLLNGQREEFMHTYGEQDDGAYHAPRDTACYAILKENQAGRGTPHGGAWLSFTHIAESELRGAFGPVVDRLAKNGIDLRHDAVEVSPIAHYHMGGLRVDERMQTRVAGLFAAGEAVGGASGANRLSGNAISEALVFGHLAGRHAADYAHVRGHQTPKACATMLARNQPKVGSASSAQSAVSMLAELSEIMWQQAGPLRDQTRLESALSRINEMAEQHRQLTVAPDLTLNNERSDWYELGAALLVAKAVTLAALKRKESRGAHQREDFPSTEPRYAGHQTVRMQQGDLEISFQPILETREN